MKQIDAVQATRQWLQEVVIGYNLCPFAGAVYTQDKIEYCVSVARNEVQLAVDLEQQLLSLKRSESVDTCLLIHPHALNDFIDYNQFLTTAESLIEVLNLTGVIQIASFHPDYCFADTRHNSAENYTNRSPYPMLHLLREESVERARLTHADIDGIPQRNINLMLDLGQPLLSDKLAACLVDSSS